MRAVLRLPKGDHAIGVCGSRWNRRFKRMVGETVSHYRIVEKLGKGGMGEVYRAEDTLLRRCVAIKVLSPERSADPLLARRFLREARAASALNHPNIVIIHDVIREEGRDCIVMECVEGTPLNHHIPLHGLDRDTAVNYTLQIAAAIGVAHRVGIVHRDLKPANVMVTASGRLKVLDFGLAKHAGDDSTAAASLTAAGTLLGTLNYMSPEQALGAPADHRSDLFSLGVMAYEMLCGQRPFQGDNLASILHAIAYAEPPALDRAGVDLPAPFGPFFERALAKDPNQRFQSAEAMAAALETLESDSLSTTETSFHEAETLLDSRVTSHSPPVRSLWDSLATAPRRRPLATVAVVLLSSTVFLALSLPGGLSSWLPSLWVGTLAGDTVENSDSLEPLELYRQARDLLDRRYLRRNLDRSVDLLEKAVAKDPSHAASRAALSEAFLARYDSTLDETWLDRARNEARKAIDLAPHLTQSKISLANVFLRTGELDSAQTEFEETLAVNPGSSEARRGVAKIHADRREYDAGVEELNRALELEPNNWLLLNDLGTLHFLKTQYSDSAEAFLKAADVSPDNPEPYRNLMGVYHFMGDFPKATEMAQKMLEIQPDAYGYSNLGTLYYFQGLYNESLAAMKKAVELEPGDYQNWANLGDVYRVISGHEADARETYQYAVKLIRDRLASGPETAILRTKLAECLARSGQSEAALAEMPRVEELAGESPSMWFYALLTYEIAGEREKALEALQKSLQYGYPTTEIQKEVELANLRRDVRYHQILMRHNRQSP